jgi:hypothetical protein
MARTMPLLTFAGGRCTCSRVVRGTVARDDETESCNVYQLAAADSRISVPGH